ncbi:DUF5337 domain-containing protein [Celeribacter sp. SCSIO 80788]|jgi:hypothetical protein|uniref:DUF5337 domain-containing protein n=1 Tax=Celeribacter sp. SCSIO 80788 TaxID=3117013 RepID=UPI003DA2D186
MVPDKDRHLAKKARTVALVIALTMSIWLGAQWLGGKLGMPVRYAFLLDLMALAAFVWAFVVIYQIWRAARQQD